MNALAANANLLHYEHRVMSDQRLNFWVSRSWEAEAPCTLIAMADLEVFSTHLKKCYCGGRLAATHTVNAVVYTFQGIQSDDAVRELCLSPKLRTQLRLEGLGQVQHC